MKNKICEHKLERNTTISTERPYDAITREVLERIRPDDAIDQAINDTINTLTGMIEDQKAQLGLEFDIKHVGSTAKRTHLRSGDIDIFLGFEPSVPETRMEEIIFDLGRRVLPDHIIRYAEHPYVRGTMNGLDIDLVPCYNVPGGDSIISAVDRTPFHTEYVISRLSQGQRDEVRLMKQFLRGIGCYGAENRTMGFSGYLSELFIIHYRTFKESLEKVSGWSSRTIIDIECAGYTGPDEKRSLIVVDPVDPSRNVASPVSLENIGLFIHAARKYIREPSLKFFFPGPLRPLTEQEITRLAGSRGEIIIISFSPPGVIDDILYPQLRMTMQRLTTLLEDHGFQLNDFGFLVKDSIYLFLDLRVPNLPEHTLHRGPQVYNAAHEERFIAKWGGHHPFLIRDRWHVLAPVKFRTARELLFHVLPEFQTGRYIMSSLKDGFTILDHTEVSPSVISHFLDRSMPWERD